MSQSNIDLVKSLYAAFGARDLDTIHTLVSPEIEVGQSTEVPWGGTYKGFDGLQQFLANLFSHVTSSLVFERFLDAGEHVVAIGRTQGKIVATGVPFDVPLSHVWQIKDGKIIRFNPYIDIPTMRASLEAQ